MKCFEGLGIALVTPFKQDGEVDYVALKNIIEHQIADGADFLCILATTAETPTLSKDEKKKIKEFIVTQVGGRVPLLMGCGGNCTATVCKELQENDWSGIDGVLSVVPYYNKPSQEGIYQHFKAIAESSPLPIVLYNVPGRTGTNMTAKTTLRIAHECKNVVAIKEASGDMAQIKQIIDGKPKGFEVISGDDMLTLQMIKEGGKGVISVIANGMTKEFADIVHMAIQGKVQQAEDMEKKYRRLYQLLFVDGNPAGIKTLMAEKGMLKNCLRLPLVPASEETTESIKKLMVNG
ncbi:MAG: 4-hydroxy-tetrahydrodipicolinate synthase [Bacteroidaceae bacterium]|nr:4-hydroxy-tetrahydrodipicolinate synthase [Bacteroidaceae bacterium]